LPSVSTTALRTSASVYDRTSAPPSTAQSRWSAHRLDADNGHYDIAVTFMSQDPTR
jgi:hypothetical protein